EHGAWNRDHPKTRYMGGTNDGAEIISPVNFPPDAPGAPWREFEGLLNDSVRPLLAEHGHHLPHHRHHQLLRYEPGANGYVHKDTDADPTGFRRYPVLVYLNDTMLG
ncbi:MAG: hypothetical protein L6Q71_02350, partial [Planctomycetes bacterium]|nr:hypothetical protein [Planctomycetota bacterium]